MTALEPRAWSNRPRALFLLGLFWAAESVLGFGLGAVMLAEGRGMPAWIVALAVALSVFLGAVGLRLSTYCLRQLGAPGPVLAIGPDGFLDRRLAPAPIPWADIPRLDIYFVRAVQVMFDLTPAADARIRPFERRLARLNRLVGLPGYSVVLMGTDAADADLARAMHAWHVATRPPPSPPGADQP